MKNYGVLADLRVKSSFHIEKAFDRGYDQGYKDGEDGKEQEYATALHDIEDTYIKGQKAEYDRGFKEGKEAAEDDMYKYYNKHFNDVVHSSNDDAYQRGYKDGMQNPSSIGYQHGYEAGLQHGQELRVKEAECAEACGMNRAWEAARKIVLTKENGGIPLSDLNEIFGAVNVLKEFSVSDAIEKIDAWEKKQEQVEKSCEKCRHDGFTCDSCDDMSKFEEVGQLKEKEEEEKQNSDFVPESPLVSCYECVKYPSKCGVIFGGMKSHCTAWESKDA